MSPTRTEPGVREGAFWQDDLGGEHTARFERVPSLVEVRSFNGRDQVEGAGRLSAAKISKTVAEDSAPIPVPWSRNRDSSVFLLLIQTGLPSTDPRVHPIWSRRWHPPCFRKASAESLDELGGCGFGDKCPIQEGTAVN
jgi:hypothetical protein